MANEIEIGKIDPETVDWPATKALMLEIPINISGWAKKVGLGDRTGAVLMMLRGEWGNSGVLLNEVIGKLQASGFLVLKSEEKQAA